jgi:hypothetical protein
MRGRVGARGGIAMTLSTVLLIVLIIILIGALPSWPYSSAWGYAPSGTIAALIALLVILLLFGII